LTNHSFLRNQKQELLKPLKFPPAMKIQRRREEERIRFKFNNLKLNMARITTGPENI